MRSAVRGRSGVQFRASASIDRFFTYNRCLSGSNDVALGSSDLEALAEVLTSLQIAPDTERLEAGLHAALVRHHRAHFHLHTRRFPHQFSGC